MASKQTIQMPRSTDGAQAGRTAVAAIKRIDPNVNLEAIALALPELDDNAIKTIAAIALASGVSPDTLVSKYNRASLRQMYDFIVKYNMAPNRDFYVVPYPTKVTDNGKETYVDVLAIQRSYANYFACAQAYAAQFGFAVVPDHEVLAGDEAIDAVKRYGDPENDIVQAGESAGKLHPSVSVARARTTMLRHGAAPIVSGWHYYVMPSAQGPRSKDRPKKVVTATTVLNFTIKRAKTMALKAITTSLFPMDPAITSESHRLLIAAQAALVMADNAANGAVQVDSDGDTERTIDGEISSSSSAPVTPESPSGFVGFDIDVEVSGSAPTPDSSPSHSDFAGFDAGEDDTADGVSIGELAAELWADRKIAGLAVKASATAGPKPDTEKKKVALDSGITALASGIAGHLGIEPGCELMDALIDYLSFDNTGSLVHFASAIFEEKDGKPDLKRPSSGFVAVREAIDVLAKHLTE